MAQSWMLFPVLGEEGSLSFHLENPGRRPRQSVGPGKRREDEDGGDQLDSSWANAHATDRVADDTIRAHDRMSWSLLGRLLKRR